MWYNSSSNNKPLEVQPVAYNRYLLHRNIAEETEIDDITGEERIVYRYEEKLVTEAEYKLMQELEARDIEIRELQDAMIELAGLIGGE